MRFAIIENGFVVNIAVADAPLAPDWIRADTGTYIGCRWDGVRFLPPPPLDPAEQRAADLPKVLAERDRRLHAVAADYTQTERETWPVQVEEAKAYTADNTAPTPMLSPLAAARSLTVDQMADRVLVLNAAFAAATGQIMGAATILLGMDPIPANMTDDIWWD